MQSKIINILPLEKELLLWYDHHQRRLPWRAVPSRSPNPYHVWLSEIMLQQTTVATVKSYFTQFVARWPTIQDLAKASLDDVFHAWQGLGYYSRARNLYLCAQKIVQDFKGVFPKEEEVLLTLPGIGPYTASAISAIAYDQPTLPVDGNIVRVFSRVFCLTTPLPGLKNEIQALTRNTPPSQRSGDFAQSLMDLGATICRPQNPSCSICPLIGVCNAYQQGVTNQLPHPALKKVKPRRYGTVFWIEDSQHQILLEKRPDKGLLAGLMGLPTTPWQETLPDTDQTLSYVPCQGEGWQTLPITVHHTFTHFHLELGVIKGHAPNPQKGLWVPLQDLKSYALPTLMKKVIHQMTSSSYLYLPK